MIPAVKICGISTFDSYQLCAGLGVDWVGFVFFPASPRHLSLVQARQLAEQADDQIDAQTRPRRVALCVDASDDELADIIDAARPHMLQLHGSETAERVQEIKSKFSLPVMPVIKVANKDDISQAAAFADCADWILFDAAPHAAGTADPSDPTRTTPARAHRQWPDGLAALGIRRSATRRPGTLPAHSARG